MIEKQTDKLKVAAGGGRRGDRLKKSIVCESPGTNAAFTAERDDGSESCPADTTTLLPHHTGNGPDMRQRIVRAKNCALPQTAPKILVAAQNDLDRTKSGRGSKAAYSRATYAVSPKSCPYRAGNRIYNFLILRITANDEQATFATSR
jgi:hypothetical protein